MSSLSLRIQCLQDNVTNGQGLDWRRSRRMSTTPLTDLLRYYRRLSDPGNRGLEARLALAQRLAREPAELVELFTRSLAQFACYSNPTQFFHEGQLAEGQIAVAGEPIADACALVITPPPGEISRTVHFAQ